MIWPFKRKPDTETRSAFPTVTAQYIDARRKNLTMDGSAALSATVGTCVGIWSRAFAMLTPELMADVLTPDILASIGLDLCSRGQAPGYEIPATV